MGALNWLGGGLLVGGRRPGGTTGSVNPASGSGTANKLGSLGLCVFELSARLGICAAALRFLGSGDCAVVDMIGVSAVLELRLEAVWAFVKSMSALIIRSRV